MCAKIDSMLKNDTVVIFISNFVYIANGFPGSNNFINKYRLQLTS